MKLPLERKAFLKAFWGLFLTLQQMKCFLISWLSFTAFNLGSYDCIEVSTKSQSGWKWSMTTRLSPKVVQKLAAVSRMAHVKHVRKLTCEDCNSTRCDELDDRNYSFRRWRHDIFLTIRSSRLVVIQLKDLFEKPNSKLSTCCIESPVAHKPHRVPLAAPPSTNFWGVCKVSYPPPTTWTKTLHGKQNLKMVVSETCCFQVV